MWVTGRTSSVDFPLQDPIIATYGGGLNDAFISKISLELRILRIIQNQMHFNLPHSLQISSSQLNPF
jgi:hypothetical protein